MVEASGLAKLRDEQAEVYKIICFSDTSLLISHCLSYLIVLTYPQECSAEEIPSILNGTLHVR